MSKLKTTRGIIAVILIIIAIVSIFVIAPKASDPECLASTIEYLDEKRETALALTAVARSASVAVSLIPGDVGNSVADSLAKLSDDFLIVFCAIFLEKYLVTLAGLISFVGLVPGALFCFAIDLIFRNRTVRSVGVKLVAFGLALFLVVPISTKISCVIEDTYGQMSIVSLEEDTEIIEQEREENSESGGIISHIKKKFFDFADAVETKVYDGMEYASNKMNSLLEMFSVMIVTTCIIPILVLIFLFWIVKLIFGIEIKPEVAQRYYGHLKPQKELDSEEE